MNKTRLEAFSDAVIAILITIMVLEFKVPAGADVDALRPLVPVFLYYILSFIYLGIYWNNHHHMFQAVQRVNGVALWANLHLLFWLSLVPFATAWMAEHHTEPLPTALYGVVLLGAAVAYILLQTALIREDPEANAVLARAVGSDLKGKVSIACYVLAILLAFVSRGVADLLFIVVAIIWLIPDRRIERRIGPDGGEIRSQ